MQHLTSQTFGSAITSGIVLVDYFATRCGPCKMIAPKIEELAIKYQDQISFYKVDVDEEQDIAIQEEIRAMPTFKFYNNGVCVETIVGADLGAIIAICEKLIQHPTE